MTKPAGDTPAFTDSLPETLPSTPRGPRLAADTVVGRYVIQEPIGEGGMGTVYVARDPELERWVALKVLRPELFEGEAGRDGRNRLVREAHAMARINHPNVVAIYDAGVHGEQVFLATELVEGPNLWTWLRSPRDWREVLGIFLKAGRGLAAAHAAGLVHRDFKPENVLLGKRGDVKVGDLGLAQAVGTEAAPPPPTSLPSAPPSAPINNTGDLPLWPLTQPGRIMGTPGYMAPEQLLGRAGDARTDEFSFCVALFQALYGARPFALPLKPQENNPIAEPPKGTSVPFWLRKILLRGFSMDPEDRYPTIAALLASRGATNELLAEVDAWRAKAFGDRLHLDGEPSKPQISQP
jgi:serine/threonine protein kinase